MLHVDLPVMGTCHHTESFRSLAIIRIGPIRNLDDIKKLRKKSMI